jgi:hypothetical protein
MTEQINEVTKKTNKELEGIKREILGEIKPAKKKRNLKFGSIVISGVLIVLTVFSIVQTIQSATILSKIKSGAIKPASAASGGSALPSSVQNLPNMVGGC